MDAARPCLMLCALALSCGPLEAEAGEGSGRFADGCSNSATPISRVQGAFDVSPLVNQVVDVRGVVTVAEPGVGFYLQSESSDADAQTSEGLFVRTGLAVSSGQQLLVRGRAREEAGATELHAIELIQACGRVAPQPVTAELDAAAGLERWEHMWVRAGEGWTLVDRSGSSNGELTVSPSGRLYAAGHELGAVAGDTGELWGLHGLAPAPTVPALRLGSRAAMFTAIVRLGASRPVLLADRTPLWRENEAPPPAAPRPELLRVAAMNLHNYFAEVGARGAATLTELVRQRAKLVAALSGLHADVLALVEVGNSLASVEHLAAGLNERRAPRERYVWSAVSPPSASPLRSVLLYRADRIEAAQEAWFELDPTFTRPPLLQRFRRGGAELTVGVVHLKSKRCDGEVPLSELEGCGAGMRAAEAAQLASAAEPAGRGRLLLIGDFNADARETPLLTLERAGWTDLLRAVPAPERYTYVFDGRATLLDHALASAELAGDAVSASIWHINADEPSSRDYSGGNPPDEYAPDARRSSDHDPISVDLRL